MQGERTEQSLEPWAREGPVNFKFEISNLKFEISNLKWLWWWLRQVSGDAAYENYLHWARRADCCAGPSERTLSREEYYLDVLRRRYSGVSRCC